MSGVRSGSIVRDKTHIHCDSCDLIGCDGIKARDALPPTDPSPEWVRHARMEGRAEFMAILLDTDPESFANDHIGDHPIADTGDYGQHWERQKLAEMFEVDEPTKSYIERVEGAYWAQENTIDCLKDEIRRLTLDAERMNWLEANRNGVQASAKGFCYWPAGDSPVTGETIRDVVDRAMEIEEAAKVDAANQ